MKHLKIQPILLCVFFAALAAAPAQSQSLSTVTATNITDLGGNHLASGKACFTAGDAKGTHIPFQPGGGGVVVDYTVCAAVTNGAITGPLGGSPGPFNVDNPGATIPHGIYYTIVIYDAFNPVRTLTGVTWSGASFSLDSWVPNTGPITNPFSIDTLDVNTLNIHTLCSGCLGSVVQANGVALNPFTYLNFQDGTGTTVTNPSQGNVRVNVTYGTTAGTATQGNDSRISGAEQTTNKDANSGYAGLDSGSKLKCSEFPVLTGDITTLGASCATALGSAVVKNNQANTYVAGNKQTFAAGATSAGLSLSGVNADPSSLANGDVWHRNDVNHIYVRLNGSTFQLATSADSITGNAATATALAANGGNCGANQYSQGVDASGVAEGCSQPSTATLSDNSIVVKNNQANSYVAGNKQTFAAGATNAGLNFAGVSADPSSLANGDVWHRTDLNQLFVRLAGATKQFAFIDSNITGNAATATALAANGGNCGANQYSQGVDASGVAEGCSQPSTSTLSDGSAVVKNNQANTFGAFLQKFRAGANFQLGDPTDFTKLVQFDLSNISTATTRTINVPDANSTLAQSFALVSHQFLTDMSAQGVHHAAQPDCSYLSNGAPSCSTDTTNAANISSGTLPGARMPALTGDTTMAVNTTVTTTAKVNGVSYGTSPATNTVAVVTGSNATTYEAVPNAVLANSSVTVAVASPITGGGSGSLGGSAPAVGCTTCATTTNGGALSALVPASIDATGQIAINGATYYVNSATSGATFDAKFNTAVAALTAAGLTTGGKIDLTNLTSNQTYNSEMHIPDGVQVIVPSNTTRISPAANLSVSLTSIVLASCPGAGCETVTTSSANGFVAGDIVRFDGTETVPLSDPHLMNTVAKVAVVTDSTHFTATPFLLPDGSTIAASETVTNGTVGAFTFCGGNSSKLSGQGDATNVVITQIRPPVDGGGLISCDPSSTKAKLEWDHIYFNAASLNHGVGVDLSGMGNFLGTRFSTFNVKYGVTNGATCNTLGCYNGHLQDINLNPGGSTAAIYLRGAFNDLTIDGSCQLTGTGLFGIQVGGGYGNTDLNPPTNVVLHNCDFESEAVAAAPSAPTVTSGGGGAQTNFAVIIPYSYSGWQVASAESSTAGTVNNNGTVVMPASAPVGVLGYGVFMSNTTGTETQQISGGASGSCDKTTTVNGNVLCLANSTFTQTGALVTTTLASSVIAAVGYPGGSAASVWQGSLVLDAPRFEGNANDVHTGNQQFAFLTVHDLYNAGNGTGSAPRYMDESGELCMYGAGFGQAIGVCPGIATNGASNLIPNWSAEGATGNATLPFGWFSALNANFNTGTNCNTDNTAANVAEGNFDLAFGNTGNATLGEGCATAAIPVVGGAPYAFTMSLNNANSASKMRLFFQAKDKTGTLIQDANQTMWARSMVGRTGKTTSGANLTYQATPTAYEFGSDITPTTTGTAEQKTYFIHMLPQAASVQIALEVTANGGVNAQNILNSDAIQFCQGQCAWVPNAKSGLNEVGARPLPDSETGGTVNIYSNTNVPTGANYLVNNTAAATTPNGQTCALGAACNVNVGAAAHSVALNQGNGAAITGVGPGTTNQILTATSSADPNYKSFSDLTPTDYVAGGGTAQAQTATLAPALTALTTGLEVRWLPAAANTGAAPTLAVNGLTAKPITKFGTAALLANDLQTNAPADAIYDGTEFILLNPQTPSIAGIHTTGLTAAVSTATLCASTAAACATAGHYHIHWDMWGSGTACSSVTAGSVTFLLTWTDANAVVHSAVALQMMGQTGAATEAMGNTFPFQTALANESASGDFNVSTNGAIIQYATGYTACTTGTGTYNLDVTVQRNE